MEKEIKVGDQIIKVPCNENGELIGTDMNAGNDLCGPKGEDGMEVLKRSTAVAADAIYFMDL